MAMTWINLYPFHFQNFEGKFWSQLVLIVNGKGLGLYLPTEVVITFLNSFTHSRDLKNYHYYDRIVHDSILRKTYDEDNFYFRDLYLSNTNYDGTRFEYWTWLIQVFVYVYRYYQTVSLVNWAAIMSSLEKKKPTKLRSWIEPHCASTLKIFINWKLQKKKKT